MNTINYHHCRHIYVDASVLTQSYCEFFFQTLIQRRIDIRLILRDLHELEEVKQLDVFDYCCDVLYGMDALLTCVEDATHRAFSSRSIVFLGRKQSSKEAIASISIGEHETFETLEEFLLFDTKKARLLKRKLIMVIAACVAYFFLYFSALEQLPTWLQEGFLSFLCCLISALCIVCSIIVGMQHGAFSVKELFEWLD